MVTNGNIGKEVIFNCGVLHGNEIWVRTSADINRIQAAEMWFFRCVTKRTI